MKVQNMELVQTGFNRKRKFSLKLDLSDMNVHEATVVLMRLGSVLAKNSNDREGSLEVAKAQLKVVGVDVTEKAFHGEV